MSFLKLELITPESHQQLEVRYLSIEDPGGRLGFQPGHAAYLTLLARAVGYYDPLNGPRHYLAFDSGLLRLVKPNQLYLVSRIILAGESLQALQAELQQQVAQQEAETHHLRQNLHVLQQALYTRLLEAQTHWRNKK